MRTNVEDYFQNGEVIVSKETFAVIKAKEVIPGSYAVISDGREITAIIDQEHVDENLVEEIDRDWRIITFDMLLPLDLVGFIAKVAEALAEEGINILTLSAYSTEHILVKETDLQKAVDKLKKLGCRVKG